MMKLCVSALLLAVAAGSLVDFLESIQKHSSFQHLSSDDKLLFGQLVVAAENNELTEFIDRVGLSDVLKLMDHMSQYDAERFAAYLAEHSNYTHHAHGHEDVINKRDFGLDSSKDKREDEDHHSSLWNLLHGHYHSVQLPEQEKNTLSGLMDAARHHRVTQYIDQVGYGAVFGLLEFSGHYADDIARMIDYAIAAEASSANRNKRQWGSHSSNHHWNSQDFAKYFENLSSQYYEHLPEQEKKTYHDIKAAAEANNLTGYIAENGYGPIFGFLEHLDYFHANQVYDYLEKALEAEKAAAASAAPTTSS